MDIRLKIKNKNSEIRANATNASSLFDVDLDTNQEYKATKYANGWYYLEDIRGWISVVNTIVVRILEPWEGGGTIDPSGEDPKGSSAYDPIEILKAILESTILIPAEKIYYFVDNKQVILSTLLRSLDSTLVDMQNVVIKVQNMESIPLLDTEAPGSVPVVVSDPDDPTKILIKWTKLSFEQLDNLPSLLTKSEW